MSERISRSMRRAVAERARSCCEYCGMPDDVPPLAHEPDHIIATQHGGQTTLGNLAYTCFRCNRFKGPNLTSIDPATKQITRLFSPRSDVWHEHFRWDGAIIVPLTEVGRATVALLRCNDPERVTLRANLMRGAHYPFAAS